MSAYADFSFPDFRTPVPDLIIGGNSRYGFVSTEHPEDCDQSLNTNYDDISKSFNVT